MGNKEMRITEDDLAIIKSLFAENDAALKVLRKIFLPEITADAPIGQVVDLWLSLSLESATPEQALIAIKARNMVITHVESQLVQLKNLAGKKEESVAETKKRLQQNSAK